MSIEQIESKTALHVSTTKLAVALGTRIGLTLRDCEGGTPLVSQDIKTDTAIGVDVGVVDACGEVDLGRLERIVGREVDR